MANRDLSREILTRLQTILWKRHDLSFLYNKTQLLMEKAINKSKEKYFCVLVARQSGKSFYTTLKSVVHALKYPGTYNVICSSTFEGLEKFTKTNMEKILETCPPKLRPKYNVQKGLYTFPNGSIIDLVGVDRGADKVRGNAVSLVIIDEAAFLPKGLEKLIYAQLGPAQRTRPEAKTILISTPPDTANSEFEQLYRHYEPKGQTFTMSIMNNPDVTKAQIDQWRSETLNESYWRREFLCEFIVDENLIVMPEFVQHKDDIVEDFVKPPYYTPFTAVDLGFVDATAGLVGYYDFTNNCICIVDEWEDHKKNSKEIVDVFKQLELKHFKKYSRNRTVDGKPGEVNDLSTLHDFKCYVPGKHDKEARVNQLRLKFQGGQIKIHKRCKKLIQQLESATWKDSTAVKKGFTRIKIGGKSYHYDLVDALLYFAEEVPTRNPYPKNYKLNPSNDFVMGWNQKPNPSDSIAKKFVKAFKGGNKR